MLGRTSFIIVLLAAASLQVAAQIDGVFPCEDQRTCPKNVDLADSELIRLWKAAATSRCSPTAVTTPSVECRCFNPNSPLKCSPTGVLYDGRIKKLCPGGTTVNLGQPCTCDTAGQLADGTNSKCPTNEPFCCLGNKFNAPTGADVGQCYNSTRQHCCNTGELYDPGMSQCCSVNGVQSNNMPCPCELDSDCTGGQLSPAFTNKMMICCRQVDPMPRETIFCSAFANFGITATLANGAVIVGTGDLADQRCRGSCIDLRFQFCCNGAACVTEYESCCNTTCCNKFVGACTESFNDGRRFSNPLNFLMNPSDSNSERVRFRECTIIEQMNPQRAFWLFILPTALLLASLLSLAIVLAFVGRSSVRMFSFVEKALIVLGIILLLLSLPLFFSPMYKYGMFFVIVALWIIVTAAARLVWLNAIAIGLLILLLIYFFDPFAGSGWFGLPYFRINDPDSPFYGRPDYRSNGVMHVTWMQFPNATAVNSLQYCTDYFDYFRIDFGLTDEFRVQNPWVTTWGYCSRDWVLALLIIEGFIIIAAFLLFVLAIIGLLLRFRKVVLEPIELEVVGMN